ncbi:MAG: disulfide bond formation protein B [Rhodospirillaceae bacterium]|nr:disulfide bond formation protein B [Rhodospirillaceae bacterium]
MIASLNQQLWLRFSPHIVAQAGIVALATAYYAQLVYGLEPCILCIYQRIPFGFVIGLGLIGMFRPALLRWVLPLAGLAFLTGSAIAFYHVGVEQHWWESTCAGDLTSQMSTTNLMQQLQMKPAKACDELEWELFGISMATYNVPYSFALAVFSFFGAYKLRG